MDLPNHRPNVGIVLFHPDGRVWYGRRVGVPGLHNWQFPQGGVDDGEDLYDAARRELAEETGITTITLLGRTEDWFAYDFPPEMDHRRRKGWQGQKQIWFAFRFDGDEREIDLNADQHVEFDAWRWGRLDDATALVVPFKREAYAEVVRAFSKYAGGVSMDQQA